MLSFVGKEHEGVDRTIGTRILPLGWPDNQRLTPEEGFGLLVDGSVGFQDGSPNSSEAFSRNHVLDRVVPLYRREGVAFLNKLRGSFAIALWDEARQRLILGADHFGTRPVYYWSNDSTLAFAPKLSSLVRGAELSRDIDPNSLYFYLNHSFIPAPFTIYRGIKRLEPGQYLLWENGKISCSAYWDMSYPEEPRIDETAGSELVRSSLEDAVKFLLANERCSLDELGAFLSGGTDSSTLVGLMSRITGRGVKSFSVGFQETQYNEIHYARIAASHFNSEAHEYFVHPTEALSALPLLARQYDEPFGNSSAIPTYFCLKAARESGVNVMFAGDGGDELFAGNQRYLTEHIFSLYHRIPPSLRTCTDFAAGWLPSFYPLGKIKNYVDKANLAVVDRFFSYQLYFRQHADRYFTDEFRGELDLDFPIDVPRRHWTRAGDGSVLNRLLYMDLKLAISDNDLFKVNRMAELHGIQVRYPYLDIKVATVSAKIPARLKLKGRTKRYIFKKAFQDLLPAEIMQKKKHGFGLPTGEWLRKDAGFRDLTRSLLLDQRSLRRGYFKRDALEGLLRNHDQEPSNYYGTHIWNLMMLELWHQNYVDGCSTVV